MKKRLLLFLAVILLAGCNQGKPDPNSLQPRPVTRPEAEETVQEETATHRPTIKVQGKLTDGTDYIVYSSNSLEISGQRLETSLKTEKALTEELKNITILTLNIEELADGCCSDLTTIQEVRLGERVRVIGSNAFSKCTALNRVVFSENLTALGDYAFQGCSSLWGADLPEGITDMGRSLFADCKSLRSVTIASDVGEASFANCTTLENITFAPSCKIIGKGAFSGCTGIKNLVLGQGIERIEDRAFSGCENIEYVYLPASLKYVGHLVMLNANKIKDVECQSRAKWGNTFRENDAFKDSQFYWPKLRETKK